LVFLYQNFDEISIGFTLTEDNKYIWILIIHSFVQYPFILWKWYKSFVFVHLSDRGIVCWPAWRTSWANKTVCF